MLGGSMREEISTEDIYKMQGLLEEFTAANQLFVGENRHMMKNNLKISENIAAINTAIELLNRAGDTINSSIKSLDQVSPHLMKQFKETSSQEVNNVFKLLADGLGKNIDLKLNDFCKKLNNESVKINKISDNYKKISRKLLLTIVGGAFLCGAVLGIAGEHVVLKKIRKITGFFSYTIHK
jgi:hypothetical protein